jgi:hypothetical protein
VSIRILSSALQNISLFWKGLDDDMEKETAPPPSTEDTASTDMDDKETAPPTRSDDKKSVEMVTSSLDEPSKIPEKISDQEKSDDEYPHGLALFFIMLGLCLAVFLIAIGKSPFISTPGTNFKLTFIENRPNNYCKSFIMGHPLLVLNYSDLSYLTMRTSRRQPSPR